MEINDYLNSTTINDVSTLSNSVNVKALEKVEVAKDDTTSFSININTYEKRSDLSTTLKEFMNNLSVNQINMQTLNQQSTVLGNLQDITTTMASMETQSQIDEYQPSVEELLSKYNYLSSNLNKNFQKYQEETNSQNYFDGMLGAKPLNPSEIIAAIEKQTENVKAEKKFFADDIAKIEKQAIETIDIEVDKSNKEAPFKNIDFGKNMANFTSANINNVIGSVALSQANAIPANSPKLLA